MSTEPKPKMNTYYAVGGKLTVRITAIDQLADTVSFEYVPSGLIETLPAVRVNRTHQQWPVERVGTGCSKVTFAPFRRPCKAKQ
jgi:hypothetical protein